MIQKDDLIKTDKDLKNDISHAPENKNEKDNITIVGSTSAVNV